MSNEFPTPGIYLHMPEEIYHSIPAFSKSLVKKFRISPIDAWEFLYGEERETTDALDYGSALHCLLLEGREAFESRYCKGFDKGDHPGAIDTVNDIKEWLDAMGIQYKSSNSKPVLIELLKAVDPEVPLVSELKEAHQSASSGKIEIPASSYDEILSRDWIRNVSFLQDAQATEVSFFWNDERLGIPCKARLDAIAFRKTPMGGMEAVIGDVKTFTNSLDRPIAHSVTYETGKRAYHIDGHFYTRALKATPRVFHDEEFANWPEFDEISFELLFVEKGRRFPNVLPRELSISNLGSLTELGQAADGAIHQAANEYRELLSRHGERPWNSVHSPDVITEADIPLYLI